MNRFSGILSVLIGSAMAMTAFGHASNPYEIRTPQGETLQFRVRSYINDNHQAEIAVAIREKHTLLPDGYVDVLYGRDLDGDGLGDLWYAVDSSGGLRAYERNSLQADGWDVAADMLENELEITSRSKGRQIFSGLYTHLTMSGAARESSLHTLMRMEMDLRELEVRADRMHLQDPKNPTLLSQYQLIVQGWGYFSGTLAKQELREELLWILADGVTLGMGGAIVRGLGGAVKAVTPQFLKEYSEKLYARYVSQAMKRSNEAVDNIALRIGEKATLQSIARLGVRERIGLQIRALTARSTVALRLAEATTKSLKVLSSAAQGGLKEWKYIAGTEALQLGAEIMNNRDTLFDWNPIVMTEHVASDKDLLQNMGFMTIETFNAAAVSSQIESVRGRLAIGAVLSTANSTATSYFVKGESDAKRMALDTGWEVLIGNSQVQVDFAALKHFEQMAEKSGNRKLKLLGWAAVAVDQFAGYVAYSAATRAYERSKAKQATPEKPPVRFVPVLAPD